VVTRAPPAHIEAPGGAGTERRRICHPRHSRLCSQRPRHRRRVHQRTTIMREIVHLQAGQCGNQIGAKVRGGSRPGEQSGGPRLPGLPNLEASAPARDGGGGASGQGQAGNKEAGDGHRAQPSVRWPQLASQLADCPLCAHKETPPLPQAAAGVCWHQLAPSRGADCRTPPPSLPSCCLILAIPLGPPVTSLGKRKQLGSTGRRGGEGPWAWPPGSPLSTFPTTIL
jgi:hypothetical protein